MKSETTENRVTVSTWAHVPLLETAGTGPTTRLAVATEQAPVRVAAEVVLDGGFGVDGRYCFRKEDNAANCCLCLICIGYACTN